MKVWADILSVPHRVRVSLVFCLAACLSILPLPPARSQQASDVIQVDPDAASNYGLLGRGVQAARLQKTVSDLASIHYTIPASGGAPAVTAASRVAGTPGGDEARQYVQAQLSQVLGADNVTAEPFAVTAPADDGASISAGGHAYALQPLWPNLVRTSTLPAKGVGGPLIYGGRGELRAFRGKPIDGSVVLLDFNCGTQWLNAARLGAKAILFVEPTETMRGEAEAKFVGIPVAIPRFWVSRADAAALESAALTVPGFSVHLACDNPWRTSTAYNLIGKIPGTDPVMGKQVVVIEAYYDSMSVVPTQAPGADTACGMASLLEIARAFKAHPPKRTVWFVACGAHFLGMQGVRTYIDRHLEQWQEPSGLDSLRHSLFHTPVAPRDEVLLFSGLDLTSQTGTVGVFYKGNFYDYREDIQGDFSDIGHALSTAAGRIGQTLAFNADTAFADGINPTGGKGWRNYLPGRFAFDAEAATMAGGKGITFATTDDARQLADTPGDTADTVNIANLVRQTRLLACQYWDLLNDTNDPNQVAADGPKGVMPVQQWPAWTRQGLRLGFSDLNGRVVVFDPKDNFIPDKGIPGTLAVVANPSKTMVGVRGNLIQATYTKPGEKRPDSNFDFAGLPLVISNGTGLRFAPANTLRVAAYRIHPADDADGARGDIDYAPDQGWDGAEWYPVEFDLTGAYKTSNVIVFPCVATSIYDLIDQQSLKALTGVRVLDGVTNGSPRQYGFVLAGNEPGVSYVEDVAVLFSAPGPTTRLKVLMDSGPAATRFLLINALPYDPRLSKEEQMRRSEGIGYAVGVASARYGGSTSAPDPSNPEDVVRNGAITNTSLRVAEDMWNLDEYRIQKLAKYRIVNDVLSNKDHTGLHDIAHQYILKALAAYGARDYDAFDSESRQAWAYEARVYPQAQGTASDVVQGVIFYLFLLIPFAYFTERLFFGFADFKKQLVTAFAIFGVIFLIFSQIHPAFDIVATSPGHHPDRVHHAGARRAGLGARLGQVRGAAEGAQPDGLRGPQGRRGQGQYRLRGVRAGHLEHAPPQGAHAADLYHPDPADVHRAVVHVDRGHVTQERRAGAGDAGVPGNPAAHADLGRAAGAGVPAAQRRVRAPVQRRPARLVLRDDSGAADVPDRHPRRSQLGRQGRLRLHAAGGGGEWGRQVPAHGLGRQARSGAGSTAATPTVPCCRRASPTRSASPKRTSGKASRSASAACRTR